MTLQELRISWGSCSWNFCVTYESFAFSLYLYLSVSLSPYLSIHLLSTYHKPYLSICLSMFHPFIHLTIYPSIQLPIYLASLLAGEVAS